MRAYDKAFKQLNQKRHVINSENANTLFPEIYANTPNAGHEYWLASDLRFILASIGIDIPMAAIDKSLNKNPGGVAADLRLNHRDTQPYKITNTIDAHAVRFTNTHALSPDSNRFVETIDFRLSRYACYNLFSDINHSEFIRFYFLRPDLDYSALHNFAREFARINLRHMNRHLQKRIAGIVQSNHAPHALFQHKIQTTLYGGTSPTTTKILHNIQLKSGDSLLNYTDATTLFAYNIAIRKALSQYDCAIYNKYAILNTVIISEIMRARRKVIQMTGTPPEKRICKTSVNNLESQFRKIHTNFVTEYSNIKIR